MTQYRFKLIQILLEAAIPLLGLYVWEWSLYFILLFYLLDLLADHLFLHIKGIKVRKEQNSDSKKHVIPGSLSIGLLLIIGVMAHLTMLSIHSDIVFSDELMAFLMLEEMGIQQGYILLPLVFYAAYQQYKLEFLMPRRYRTMNSDQLWRPALRSYLLIIAFSGLALGISFLFHLSESVYVWGIVGVSSIYKFLLLKP